MPPYDNLIGGTQIPSNNLFDRFNSPATSPTASGTTRNTGLSGIIDEQFSPELERLDQGLPGLEELLMDRISSGPDFQQFAPALEQFAGNITDQFFGAGGAVEQASRQALGQAVGSGFGPTSGGFDAARMNILRGATEQVGQAIGSQAVNLAQVASGQRSADIQTLLGLTGLQAGRRDELARDIFGITQTGIANEMDRETLGLNRRLIEEALRDPSILERIGGSAGSILSGAGTGAAIGSIVPGLGTGVGAALGGTLGLIGGLFG
jgi:hypothetical protein